MASNSASSSSSSGVARGSIRTPLTPASVKDLKAKFDPGKGSDGGGSAHSTMSTVQQRNSQIQTSSPVSGRKDLTASSDTRVVSTSSSTKSSTSTVTLSSVSLSLQAAAQRKLTATSSASSSATTTLPSSNLRSSSKSTVALTTARSFSPSSLSSSKSGSPSSSGRSSPSLDGNYRSSAPLSLADNKREQKSLRRTLQSSDTACTTRTSRSARAPLSPSDIRSSFERNKDGTQELPVMQISTSRSEVTVEIKPTSYWTDKSSCISERKTDTGSSYIGNKVPEQRAALDSNSFSSTKTALKTENSCLREDNIPVQRSSKLVAKEIKIERLDTGINVTSYKEIEQSASKNRHSAAKTDSNIVTVKTKTKSNGVDIRTKTESSAVDANIKSENRHSAAKTESNIVDAKAKTRSSAVDVTTKTQKNVVEANIKSENRHSAAKTESIIIDAKAKTRSSAVDVKAKTESNSVDIRSTGKPGEIKAVEKLIVQQSSTSKTKNETQPLEFTQVKLRKTRSEQSEGVTKISSPRNTARVKSSDTASTNNVDADDKRASRKISSERFERLMFDFQRGVPTETIVRRGSETDHIALQQKARELSKPLSADDVPIIAKKKKETSIFTEGLKVSDFVKQVNKMNPEAGEAPKWKVHRAQSQTSSAASSDVGGDNFYQGIPGEDVGVLSDDDDDIYEKVAQRAASSTDGELEECIKSPGKRLGVYSQMKHFTNCAFKKLKQRGSKKKKTDKNRLRKSDIISDSEERVTNSDGGGEWSSSGTDYEDVSPDGVDHPAEGGFCLYEDLENFTKPSDQSTKNKTITYKLKKIFYKSGANNKKSKSFIDSGVSAGTESEADTVDDTEEVDSDVIETFSRTSSERSSGRLVCDNTVRNSTSSIGSSAGALNVDERAVANQPQATMSASSIPPAPALPLRTTKLPNQPQEDSPPLPPRNPSSKATLGNPQEMSMPISPTGKSSGESKIKDVPTVRENGPDVSDRGANTEHVDNESPLPSILDKLERTDRKTGSSAHTIPASSTTVGAASVVYPDINTFPELKGDDVNLYVDLEDEQIYGKASVVYVSKFQSEPLYQWYSKDKVIQNLSSDKSTSDDLSSDDEFLEEGRRPESLYEDVEKLLEKTNDNSKTTKATAATTKTKGRKDVASLDQLAKVREKPERRSVIEDVLKNGGSLHRALWCQMPEVIVSGLLEKLSDQEKKIQEAMFEIITSEASYLKSLKVLISVFLMAPEFSAEMSDKCVVTRRDRQILFSNIGHIKDISEEFLKDLEDRWQQSCYMQDICDIIHKHASQKFEPYVRYCSNQAFQDRVLNTLRLNTDFMEAVKKLEQHPDCQCLPLASFLLLPMQRITRLPLLVDAIYHRLDPTTSAHASAKKAMDSLTKVAKRCDEAAKKMQQTEQICMLKSNLEFKVKEFPLISASRYLVKQGELTQIKVEGKGHKPLSKLLGSNKEHVYLFLFNDILLLAKKKGTTFQVRDYCQRNALHVEAIDNPDKTRHLVPGTATGVPNILFLAMLANHENRQVEMVLSCKSESERTRWIDAIMPTRTSSESERIYDCWDCPQFHCVRKYIAQQPDELNLEESDVINVTRKMADGWYEGERIRDGEKGWFPASHTEEINNSHVRARNLRLRYRLMRASQEYSQTELVKKMTI